MLHRCYLGLLGLSFSTHSRILICSEYFHYKIFIHEKCLENKNDKFQENFSRPGLIDARARYRAAARRLRNTGLDNRGTTICCLGTEQLHCTQCHCSIWQEEFKAINNLLNIKGQVFITTRTFFVTEKSFFSTIGQVFFFG